MTTTTLIQSLPSTAETDVGPLVEQAPGTVIIRYDREGPNGPLWTAIRFSAMVAYRFTPDVSCDELMIEAYSRLLVVEDSSWFEELRRRAKAVGQDLSASLQHFEVYFDHLGCIEVLAEAADVDADAG